jgi:hypothetical protein
MDETKLLDEKKMKDMKEVLFDTKKLITKHTDTIPTMEQLDDENKGHWIEHGEGNFYKMFEGLLDYCADEEEYDNLDWNTVNFNVYGEDYYRENFEGFPDEVYQILAKSTEHENKFLDETTPNLKIEHKETIIKFD